MYDAAFWRFRIYTSPVYCPVPTERSTRSSLDAKDVDSETPKAWGGVRNGEGYPPSQTITGSGGASIVSSPGGVRAEPRPKWNYVKI